ncbi:KdsC family phosphatase [Granulicella cerasi]|uniref:KdsC family phosphatase n=1 Tax=Granulicella cerasi TaxID=741063 RepID=A0ABW1Z743_9BACT|nr:haloacid dehalogenase-like hydrolase [Granulicella cerasi]
MMKAVAFDVDGVLTDGRLTWSAASDAETKSFHFRDIMGLSLLRRAGITLALISGEPSPLVDRFAAKLRIPFVRKGVRDKASVLREFAEAHALNLDQIAFVGDDVNDLPAMELAALAACPADAAAEVIAFVQKAHGFVTVRNGGCGAVREFADAMLRARGLTGRETFQLPAPETP